MRRPPPALHRPSPAFAAAFMAATLVGCAHPPGAMAPTPAGLTSPFTGYASARYGSPSAWLCLPGRDDACAGDATATGISPDGARAFPDPAAPASFASTSSRADPGVDCFYVYPTVDMSLGPANHDDFSDTGPEAHAALAQVARFRGACRVYAPLYRQITIGAYLRSGTEAYLAVAFSDVADAFLEYMSRWNAGRRIVLIGHSQGGDMTARLLKRFFDDDPRMTSRLVYGMPIGYPFEVKKGAATGGTLAHIPLCTERGQEGCVVAYRSRVEGDDETHAMPAPGNEIACVSPSWLARGSDLLAGALLPSKIVSGVDTPFVDLHGAFRARCTSPANGSRTLAVSTVADPPPVDLTKGKFHGYLGLHVVDLQLPQDDLIALVAAAAARPPSAEPSRSGRFSSRATRGYGRRPGMADGP